MGSFDKKPQFRVTISAGDLKVDKVLSDVPEIDFTDNILTIDLDDEYYLMCSLDLTKGHYFCVSKED